MHYFEESLQIRKKCFGESNAEVAWSMGSIAKVHLACGEPGEVVKATELLKRAYKIFISAFGPESLPDHKSTKWTEKKLLHAESLK